MKKFLPLLALVAFTVSLAAQGGAAQHAYRERKGRGLEAALRRRDVEQLCAAGQSTLEGRRRRVRPEVAGGWLATKEDFTNFQLQRGVPDQRAEHQQRGLPAPGRQDGDSHQIGYELQIRNPSPGDKPYDGKERNHNAYYTGSFSGHLKSKNEPTVIMGQWHRST